jgi:hypothetical protein
MQMKADGLTKPLSADKQAHFVRLIGLTKVLGWRKDNKNNNDNKNGEKNPNSLDSPGA